MTIFATWQLIATLDSIRNSCDVFTLSLFNLLYGQMGGEIIPTQTKKIKSTDIYNPNNGCGMYELICHCYIHTRTRVAWISWNLKCGIISTADFVTPWQYDENQASLVLKTLKSVEPRG